MDRICRSLVNAGNEVWLIGRERPHSLPLVEQPYRQIRLPLKRQKGKGFYAEYNYKLWQYLKTQHWDAINAVDLDTILPAYWAARSCKAKLVYDAHEYFSETPEVVNRPLIRNAWRLLGKWLVPKAELSYTVGPELAKVLEEEYGVAFGVVRNVPKKSRIANLPTSKLAKKIILYQGMLNQGRGIGAAIKALRLLPAEYVLWLVGNGDLETALKPNNQDLIDAGRLVFHGFVPGPQLEKYTRQAWLGLNLLNAVSPSYYYSLANKCFDYIQCGLPSVQMDFPEYVALEKQYGCFLMVDRIEPSRLAINIQRLGDDHALYQKMRQGCLEAAKALIWENEEQELLRLWNTI